MLHDEISCNREIADKHTWCKLIIILIYCGQKSSIQFKEPFRSDRNIQFIDLFDQLLFCVVRTRIISTPKDKLFHAFDEPQFLVENVRMLPVCIEYMQFQILPLCDNCDWTIRASSHKLQLIWNSELVLERKKTKFSQIVPTILLQESYEWYLWNSTLRTKPSIAIWRCTRNRQKIAIKWQSASSQKTRWFVR